MNLPTRKPKPAKRTKTKKMWGRFDDGGIRHIYHYKRCAAGDAGIFNHTVKPVTVTWEE